ncbi:hypothetical protein EYR38_006851 [Pleurotus pulmonarius]|nr:hypothetical protein EYR38_006851 [Pleurotus pulmonarius]
MHVSFPVWNGYCPKVPSISLGRHINLAPIASLFRRMSQSTKFLFCLPLRVGVFVVAIFQLLLNGALALLFWYGFVRFRQLHVLSGPYAGVIIYAVTFSVGFLMAILGLVGVIRRHYHLISLFLRLMVYMAIYITIYFMVTLSSLLTTSEAEYIQECTSGSQDQGVWADCKSEAEALNDPRVRTVIVVVFFIIPATLQFYGVYIVNAYHTQLQLDRYFSSGILPASSKRQSWTIDGEDSEIEPTDWTSVSARGSQVDLVPHATSSRMVPPTGSESIPLTSDIGSAFRTPEIILEPRERASSPII